MKGAVMVSLKLRKTLILILKRIKFIIRTLTQPASQVRTKKNRLPQTVDFSTTLHGFQDRIGVAPYYINKLDTYKE